MASIIIKTIATFSEDAIYQAMERMNTDRGKVESLLKPIIDALLSQVSQPKVNKSSGSRGIRMSDKDLFEQRVMPQISQKLLKHETESLTTAIILEVNLDFDMNFCDMSMDQMVLNHTKIVQQEDVIQDLNLVLKYHRGLLYCAAYRQKPAEENCRVWFREKFGVVYQTALRYMSVTLLLLKWPVLLVCDLSYAQLLKHNKRLQSCISNDEKLSARLGQEVKVKMQGKDVEIKPSDEVTIPCVKHSADPDALFKEEELAGEATSAVNTSSDINQMGQRNNALIMRPLVCKHCRSRMFSDFDTFRKHIRRHRNQSIARRRSVEPVRGALTSTRHQPSSDINQTGQRNNALILRPLVCKYCRSRMFSDFDTFRKHIRRHRNQSIARRRSVEPVRGLVDNCFPSKKYQCAYCDKSFSRSSSKTKHERIHTNEKPYQCVFCNKSFSDSSGKTRHERIHTKDKP